MDLPPVLDSLPAPYRALLARALTVLGEDGRVMGLWVSGSWARGEGDPASDLDLVVATTDAEYSALIDSARLWWADITPTVLLETVPYAPNIWYSVTPDGHRLDIAIEKASDLPRSPHRWRLALLDPEGLSAKVPPPPEPSGPDPGGVEWRLKELLRALCLLPVVVTREDWLLGVQGCALMQRTLADLYAASNGTLSAYGVKHYSGRLTSEQRVDLASLPPVAATREAVVAGHQAVLALVLRTVPPVAIALGIEWPKGLEETARRQVAAVVRSS